MSGAPIVWALVVEVDPRRRHRAELSGLFKFKISRKHGHFFDFGFQRMPVEMGLGFKSKFKCVDKLGHILIFNFPRKSNEITLGASGWERTDGKKRPLGRQFPIVLRGALEN
jgi:hypothetical protein